MGFPDKPDISKIYEHMRPVNVRGYQFHVPKTVELGGWRFFSLFVGITGFIGLMLYPIVADPMLHIDKYKKIHEENQSELFQSGLLPGQLKKWEDPWVRKRVD